MSQPEPIDHLIVTLGGKPYKIGQLTIGQQRDLQIGCALPNSDDPQENIRRAFERNLNVIFLALKLDHPDLTMDTLLEMRGSSPQERVTAVNTILEFAGLIPKDAKSGEANAGSTGQP